MLGQLPLVPSYILIPRGYPTPQYSQKSEEGEEEERSEEAPQSAFLDAGYTGEEE
jgi:hypothetical protein